jgi:hypothetical protein
MQEHLADCAACREELALWSSVASALSGMASEVKAPSGFARSVMAEINTQPHSWYTRMPQVWKQGVAAAAAFAVIAAGSLGLVTNQFWARAPLIAENPGTEVVLPGPRVTNIGENRTEVTSPVANGVGDKPSVVADPVIPSNGGVREPGTAATNITPQADPTPREQVAFLNLDQARVIKSTMLGLEVNSLIETRQQVAAVAQQANGKSEQLGVYNTAQGRAETIKVTVPSEKAAAVITKLSGLGEVVTKEDNSRDISKDFRNRVEQYLALHAQREAATDPAEQAELDQKLAGLEKQLRAWVEETGQYTIVVQLLVR